MCSWTRYFGKEVPQLPYLLQLPLEQHTIGMLFVFLIERTIPCWRTKMISCLESQDESSRQTVAQDSQRHMYIRDNVNGIWAGSSRDSDGG